MSVNRSADNASGESRWGLLFLLCQVCVFFSSCSPVLMRSLPSKRGQERTSREKKEGFPLYRCSQQGIMLLFCPGSKPFAAGWSSQDGSSLQGQGIFPFPPSSTCACVCVQPSLFMPAHFICFAVGTHRLPWGRTSPQRSPTKAATIWKHNYLFIPSFSFYSLSFLLFVIKNASPLPSF